MPGTIGRNRWCQRKGSDHIPTSARVGGVSTSRAEVLAVLMALGMASYGALAASPTQAAPIEPSAAALIRLHTTGPARSAKLLLRLGPTPGLDGLNPTLDPLTLAFGAAGMGTSGVLTLDPLRWVASAAGGYRYADPGGTSGGIIKAKMIPGSGGTELQLTARGANWPWHPESAVGAVLVRIAGGNAAVCATFGGHVVRDAPGDFFARNASAPAACEPLCGDGNHEAIEACDDGNLSDDDSCTRQCGWMGRGVWVSAGALDWPAEFEDFLDEIGVETATYFYSVISARDRALEGGLSAGGPAREAALTTFLADPHWDLVSIRAGLADPSVYPEGLWPQFHTSNPALTGGPGQLVMSDYESDSHIFAGPDVWATPPVLTPLSDLFAEAAREMALAVKDEFPTAHYSHYGVRAAPNTYFANPPAFDDWFNVHHSVARALWIDAQATTPQHAWLAPGHHLYNEAMQIVAGYERERLEEFPYPAWLTAVDFLNPTLYHSSALPATLANDDNLEAIIQDEDQGEVYDPSMHLAVRKTLRGVREIFLPVTGPERDQHTPQYWVNLAQAERALRDAAGTKPVIAVVGMHDAVDPAVYSIFHPIPLDVFIENCVAPARDAGVAGVVLWSPMMQMAERSTWNSHEAAILARTKLRELGMPDAPAVDDHASWMSPAGRAASTRFAAFLHEPYLRALRDAFP